MKIIGIVGMPGSGKTEALNIIKKMGIPVFNMGDVVTKIEPKRRGITALNEYVEEHIRIDLRERFGPAAIAIMISKEIEKSDSDIVAVAGIHSFPELDYFRGKFGQDFILISIECGKETRFSRLEKRKIRPLNRDEFEHREKYDRFDIPEIMEKANYKMNNEIPLNEFKKELEKIIKEVVPK